MRYSGDALEHWILDPETRRKSADRSNDPGLDVSRTAKHAGVGSASESVRSMRTRLPAIGRSNSAAWARQHACTVSIAAWTFWLARPRGIPRSTSRASSVSSSQFCLSHPLAAGSHCKRVDVRLVSRSHYA